MKKARAAAVCMAVVMGASLVGCGGNEGNKTGVASEAGKGGVSENTTKRDGNNTNGTGIKIGLVLSTGGLGDKNFNDMAYAGITKAQDDFGVKFDYVEPNSVSDFLSFDRQFAQSGEYDLLIALGSDQEESIRELIGEYPNQKISLLDSGAEIEGVSTVQTQWSEQTFLAGVIAGLGTKSDMKLSNKDQVIGVILGMDQPNLREGLIGFTAGAKYVNPDVEVLEGVVGAFNDPGKGKEMALSMYSKGADFIQCIAGASGLGVFGAAKEAGRYAFGVGSNQNGEDPDHIPASSVRSVDEMVYNEVKSIVEGTWKPGLHMSGMKENAVGCDTKGSNVVIPDDIKAKVEDVRKKIVSGELVPCKSAKELDPWLSANHYEK